MYALYRTYSSYGHEDRSTRATDNTLAAGEKKSLTICFHLEEDTGNDMQEELLSFDFSVKAVQAKNNPDKNFD